MADALYAHWLDHLVAAGGYPERCQFLAASPDPAPPGAILEIQQQVLACVYADPARAAALADCARAFADVHPDPLTSAFAARIQANVAYTQGQHEAAVELYSAAMTGFEALGEEVETGRTLSSGLQTLLYLSRYDEARAWADRAESIFLRHGDTLRLARLDSNIGNLHFRLDQHKAAIARYERALAGFGPAAQPSDVGAVLINLASCYTALGQFAPALESYRRAREHCQQHGLVRLTAQADYNIAWLWYLRGDYREARRLFALSREHAEATGDAYHAALCDLDESELYLELNLTTEGLMLARRSASAFDTLGMRYEHAKSLVSVAVAESQAGSSRSADRTLRNSRELFVEEGNQIWPALIDLLRAVLAFHDGRPRTARRLASSAWKVLSKTTMPGKATQCLILLARLWLKEGYPDRARAVCREALARLGDGALPSLCFHANLVLADCAEMQGRWSEAWDHCETARQQIEQMRGRVDTEDLRISVLKDKLAVYETMVMLCLDSQMGNTPESVQRALLLIQEAKSRSLSDRLAASDAPEASGDDPGPASRTRIREDLNWHYRQIELATLLGRQSETLDDLQAQCRALESELLTLSHTARPPDADVSHQAQAGIAALQAIIPAGTVLLEYFETRSTLWVCVLSRERCHMVRLGPSAPVWQEWKLLRFQLGRCAFYPGDSDVRPLQGGDLSTRHHLAELHRLLIQPVLPELPAGVEHLVVAPHRTLHGVPFAALVDPVSGLSLIDRFTVSSTPSARVWAACQVRPPSGSRATVVMAVPDPRAPAISAEARAVCEIFPDASLFLGEDATSATLVEKASGGLNLLHLAAHGTFRRDNPLFSSIRLADGPFSLFDLRQHRLAVNLIALSACNTGASVSVGGDELLGLMRGFLSAGARSLLVSLWEIDDASTAEFMRFFYRRLQAGEPSPVALAGAMKEVRRTRHHPWYWAPFTLVGAAG